MGYILPFARTAGTLTAHDHDAAGVVFCLAERTQFPEETCKCALTVVSDPGCCDFFVAFDDFSGGRGGNAPASREGGTRQRVPTSRRLAFGDSAVENGLKNTR